MPRITVAFSEDARNFIKSRVEGGDYLNGGEYIRDLIRRDVQRLVEEGAWRHERHLKASSPE